MKRIGYTGNSHNFELLKNVCDHVIYFEKKEQTSQDFLDFIQKNLTNQIIIKNIEDIGLQLVQMVPGLIELKERKKDIVFLEKGHGAKLSDENFTGLLLEYAIHEKEIMRGRTIDGINSARNKGIKYGRPKIEKKTIQEIQYLAKNGEWSVREIAEKCNVSIGTAHKYSAEIKKNTNRLF